MERLLATAFSLFFLVSAVSAVSVRVDELGVDENNQYSYYHDYRNARVTIEYDRALPYFDGLITGSGLKPYATYQVKLLGKPTCGYADGNDLSNEYVGLNGRWTCMDCEGSAESRNRDDRQYYAKSQFRGDRSECIQGYLVFDFFTAGLDGKAIKRIECKNSYHVLWCGGGSCNSANNKFLQTPDSNHPDTYFCAGDRVDGKIERNTCGGLQLAPGDYDVVLSLTEESFHKGNWATVLSKPIAFTITATPGTTIKQMISSPMPETAESQTNNAHIAAIYALVGLSAALAILWIARKYGKSRDKAAEDAVKNEMEVQRKELEAAKRKYHHREIDEDSFKQIAKDHNAKIIQLEVKLKSLLKGE